LSLGRAALLKLAPVSDDLAYLKAAAKLLKDRGTCQECREVVSILVHVASLAAPPMLTAGSPSKKRRWDPDYLSPIGVLLSSQEEILEPYLTAVQDPEARLALSLGSIVLPGKKKSKKEREKRIDEAGGPEAYLALAYTERLTQPYYYMHSPLHLPPIYSLTLASITRISEANHSTPAGRHAIAAAAAMEWSPDTPRYGDAWSYLGSPPIFVVISVP